MSVYSALVGALFPASSSQATTTTDFVSLFVIAGAAVLGPLLSAATRKRIPDVVWLLILGVVIGPSGFGIASITDGVDLFRQVGMGMLFLIAGTEVNISELHARPGRVAIGTWVACFVLALAFALWGISTATVSAAVALAIALTSTALGTLIPILMEAGLIGTPAGKAVLVHGAVGELAPVVAMSLLLGTRSPGAAAAVLLLFVVATLVSVALPTRFVLRHPGVGRVILRGAQTSSKTLMRVVMLILTGLMALSAVLDLDVVLGAFAAGVIVKTLAPVNFSTVESELRTLGFSFLIPLFFVTSGMNISLKDVIAHPFMLVFFVVAILVVRGVPIVLAERIIGSTERQGWRSAVKLGLYGATGLPIIVAVTEVAVAESIMPSDIASILVAAGGASVLLFPLLASLEDRVPTPRILSRAPKRAR
ncbi:cation:proton antiporter [Actinomyces culturomici]|uniref:cation:proton antiporter n=1 Tax=Actinomyces culturomici TaxID=1926276 RepID=UPI000E1FDD04|nr:cation:proton antiporter [Actinomyces culturomici]